MRIGVYPFHACEDISRNHQAIVNAIRDASKKGVRLLVFQECAACGYPPIETPDIKTIDFDSLEENLQKITHLAQEHRMYIALGTIRKQGASLFNSMQIISPDGAILGSYDKRALWGWDVEHFKRGESLGIYSIDGVKVGFRICFEVRFPEYFRELYKENVPLCFVSFCDVGEDDCLERYQLIRSHLVTRAVENVMTVVSVNSISNYQTAPTAVIDPNGHIVLEAPRNKNLLLVHEYTVPEVTFGMSGRIENSNRLMQQSISNHPC